MGRTKNDPAAGGAGGACAQRELFEPPLVWGITRRDDVAVGQLVRLDLTGRLLTGRELHPGVPPRVCVVAQLPCGTRYVDHGDTLDWLPAQREALQALDALEARLDEGLDSGLGESPWAGRARYANTGADWKLSDLSPPPPAPKQRVPKRKLTKEQREGRNVRQARRRRQRRAEAKAKAS